MPQEWATFINQTGFPIALCVAIGLFLWWCVWKWFRDEYWPFIVEQRKKRAELEAAHEKEQTDLYRSTRDAIVEIKVLIGQQLQLMQQHDTTSEQNQKVLVAALNDKLQPPTAEGQPK